MSYSVLSVVMCRGFFILSLFTPLPSLSQEAGQMDATDLHKIPEYSSFLWRFVLFLTFLYICMRFRYAFLQHFLTLRCHRHPSFMETLFNVPSPSAVSMRQLSDKTQFAVEPVLPPILSDSGRPLIISHINTIKQNLDKKSYNGQW